MHLTREHLLVIGGETGVVTNALQRRQDMVVRAGPIRSRTEAGVDVVPGTFTIHEVHLAAVWHIRERSVDRIVGEPEELMEEGNMVLLRDCFSGSRRIAAVCRPCAAHLAPH